MKMSALMIGLIVCGSSFAAEINGFKISGLPTVTQSYGDSVDEEKDIASAKEAVKAKCLAGKASGEAFAAKNGFKIVSSKGCDVSVNDRRSDYSADNIHLDASFEIVLK